MSSLRNETVTTVLSQVTIIYLTRAISSWWNERRGEGDLPSFCGWYWIKGRHEGGPFRTRSSAIRDAHYRFVLREEQPRLWVDMPRSVARTSAPYKQEKKQ